MFKSKDLYEKNIYDSNGKKLGRVKDIIIDFKSGKVAGLGVSNSKNKIRYVNLDEAGNVLEESKLEKIDGILFSELKNIEVIDTSEKDRGIIDDLFIDEESFEVKALVLTLGTIDSIIKGNEIILMRNVMMLDDYILYFGESNVTFKNIPHNLNKFKSKEQA